MRFAIAIAVGVAGCASFMPEPQIITRVDTVIVTKRVAPSLVSGDTVELCLSTGMPARVVVSAQGDTLVNGIRVDSMRPILTWAGSYMAAADTLRFEKRLYRRAGAAAARGCDELKNVGAYHGISIFADVTAPQNLPAILWPVRPGMFQEYRVVEKRR